MRDSFIAEKLKEAFFEGYDSYETACNSFTTVERAWNSSNAKEIYDKLMGR